MIHEFKELRWQDPNATIGPNWYVVLYCTCGRWQEGPTLEPSDQSRDAMVVQFLNHLRSVQYS